MELWLLVGAAVLVALTVWIVWPVQRTEEVPSMTSSNTPNPNQPNIPPQGDAFEDQYTSATADLSAGGVATSIQGGTAPTVGGPTTESTARSASEAWSSPVARAGADQPMLPPAEERALYKQPRTLGAGATALLAVGGGIAGAWLYQRRQRERNKPINRLRRRAQDFASRLPEVDELPDNTAPFGGVAAALLATAVLIARARRQAEPELDLTARQRAVLLETLEQGRSRAREKLELGRERAREGIELGRDRARRLKVPEVPPPPRETILGGLGVGGTAMLVGAVFLVWRLLRGGGQGPRHKYAADRMGE